MWLEFQARYPEICGRIKIGVKDQWSIAGNFF